MESLLCAGLRTAWASIAASITGVEVRFAIGRRSFHAIALLLPLWASAAPMAWFADDTKVYQADASTRGVLRSVSLSAQALAAEPSGGAWVVGNSAVMRIDSRGSTVLTLPLSGMGLTAPVQVAADPRDGSAWLMGDRTLLHLSLAGQLLRSVVLPGDNHAVALAVGLDGRVWALGKTWLVGVSANGSVGSQTKVSSDLGGPATAMALDPLSPTVWVVREDTGGSSRRIVRIDTSSAQLSAASIASVALRGAAADVFAGGVFTLPAGGVHRYSQAGTLVQSLALSASTLGAARRVAADPSAGALWLGRELGITVIAPDGALLREIATGRPVTLLSLSPFRPVPTLTLLTPMPPLVTNNRQPTITLAYGVDCYGAACALATGRLGAYALSAQLNGIQIGPGFAFDGVAARASYTPASLADGAYALSATLVDGFGQISNTLSSTITIDTQAPRLIELSPPDGGRVTQPGITLAGRINEPGVIQLGNATVQGSAFSIPVILTPGVNSLPLRLTDIAGNSVTQPITLTLANAGIALTIDAPTNGAVVAGQKVTVSGILQGPPNTGITVNDVVVGKVGNRYAAEVSLVPGANSIVVVATEPDGGSAQASITVTRTGDSALRLSLVRARGVAPFTAGFTVVNLTGKQITGVSLDKDGDGTPDATGQGDNEIVVTYASAGIYLARATITFDDGTQALADAMVVVEDAATIDADLRAIWQRFVAALAAGDRATAVAQFNEGARERYEPILTSLAPHLPSIAASFSPLGNVSLNTEIGEYAVTRLLAGRTQLYMIYFLRGPDGVWRLDSM